MNQAAVSWLNPSVAAATPPTSENRQPTASPAEPQTWPTEEDVHFQAIAGDVRQAPGAGGDQDVSGVVRNILDRVRRNIRERADGKS